MLGRITDGWCWIGVVLGLVRMWLGWDEVVWVCDDMVLGWVGLKLDGVRVGWVKMDV